MNQSIILSSSGLRNIAIHDQENEKQFTFKIGSRELKMHQFFAEFLSPIVAHLHHSDPTIDFITFDDYLARSKEFFDIKFNDILKEEHLNQLQQISRGYSIEISKKDSFLFRHLSLLLGNEELYNKIDTAFPMNFNNLSSDDIIKELRICKFFSDNIAEEFYSKMIGKIASQFEMIDYATLRQLPKSILYSIISNEQFKSIDEDSLVDFINQLFLIPNEVENNTAQKAKEQGDCITDFYEIINFSYLSPLKLQEVLQNIDFREITATLWNKICEFINNQSSQGYQSNRETFSSNDNYKFFEYNRNSQKLQGIINYLTEKYKGNVSDKGVVSVTSSSIGYGIPNYVVDLNNSTFFQTSNLTEHQWIEYDFTKRRIKPTHYVIRTRTDGYDLGNPQNWVIEGSNTHQKNDWKILDSRHDENSTKRSNTTSSFKIRKLKENESYRYLRIRQTGKSSNGYSSLTLTALEFYGKLIE